MATVRNQIGNGKDAGGVSGAKNAANNLMKERGDAGKSGKPYPHSKDSSRVNTKVPQLFKRLHQMAVKKGSGMFSGGKSAGVRSSHDQSVAPQGKGGGHKVTPPSTSLNKGVKVTHPQSKVAAHYGIVKGLGTDKGGGQKRVNPGIKHGTVALFKTKLSVTGGLRKGVGKAKLTPDSNLGKPVFQGKGRGQRLPQPGSRPKGMLKPKNEMPSNFKGAAAGDPKGY